MENSFSALNNIYHQIASPWEIYINIKNKINSVGAHRSIQQHLFWFGFWFQWTLFNSNVLFTWAQKNIQLFII